VVVFNEANKEEDMSIDSMKSRERVMAALNHQEPDKIPRDLGGTFTTSLHVGAHSKLKRFLKLEGGSDDVDNYQVRTAVIDPRIVQKFGSDCVALKTKPSSKWKLHLYTDSKGYQNVADEWGVVRGCPPEGYYFDVVLSPLAEATMTDLDCFPWPDPLDPGRFDGLVDRARSLYEETDKCIILSVGTSLFAQIGFMMGWEKFLICTAENPPLIKSFVEHLLDFNQKLLTATLDRIGKYVQVFNMYDDLTHQHNLFVSRKTLKDIFMPAYKKLFTAVKRKGDIKILFHICGASRLLFEDLVSIGVDAFNPIQVAAEGMDDTASLKKIFGEQLTFWGGGCDARYVLPSGTTDEVRREVRRRIADLAPGGGFVFCPIHNIQAEVPPENIVAMYDEVSQWESYPIRVNELRNSF
jgi:uroporphyrinogen decarboxylase